MTPTKIKLHKRSQELELAFAGSDYRVSAEYLRVHSPSAEVKGHGPGQAVLQHGKRGVAIVAVEMVGNYAIKLVFSDGHDTGIYTWPYLYQLSTEREQRWQDYLTQLHNAKLTRDAQTSVVNIIG